MSSKAKLHKSQQVKIVMVWPKRQGNVVKNLHIRLSRAVNFI